jgi:3-oxoacyl-[acyl-carrier-protein] synthase-1
MRVAMVPWLDIGVQDVQRFKSLLFPAINQIFSSVKGLGKVKLRLALAFGLPDKRPGLPDHLCTGLMNALNQCFPGFFAEIAAFPNGHSAGFLALEAAAKKIMKGDFDACIVAGVESYMEPETLKWLEQCDQLHGAGPLNNAWGFIPGEAAGAILLIRSRLVTQLEIDPIACIWGVGVSFETKRIKTETVCIGEGLTQAFHVALEALPDQGNLTDIYCDMNGEPYRADEYAFACLRTKEHFRSASDFVAPADCWGDVSSATGPLLIGLAAIAGHKGYAKGNYALAWASSEGGERGAALLESRRLTRM